MMVTQEIDEKSREGKTGANLNGQYHRVQHEATHFFVSK